MPSSQEPKRRRKRGRPALPPEKRKRNNFTMRLRDGLKERLQESAADKGRSLSEEAELRLELSYYDEDARIRAFGGDANYFIMQALTSTIKAIETETGSSWRKDPVTSLKVQQACWVVLRAFGPTSLRKGAPGENLNPEVKIAAEQAIADTIQRQARVAVLSMAVEDQHLESDEEE